MRVAVEALQFQAQRCGAAQRAVVYYCISRRQELGYVGRALHMMSRARVQTPRMRAITQG